MVNGPPRHAPKTLKQAKQEYKLRSGPQLSAQQLRQLERRLELDERAKKCKEKEKRRKELAKRRKEKEEKEREKKKTMNVSLATQLAGFNHTQIGLKRKMDAWIGLGNGGASKRQKIDDEKTASESEDEFDASDKENERAPRTPSSNQSPRRLSAPRRNSSTNRNMPPVEPAERSRSENNHKQKCNSQRSTSGTPFSFHTALDDFQDDSNLADEEDEFDLIDDDELLNALGPSDITIPSSKSLPLKDLGFTPNVMEVLQRGPFESEGGRTDLCLVPRSSKPTFQQAPVAAVISVDIQDIPDDFWVTGTQLERDMEEPSQETLREEKIKPKEQKRPIPQPQQKLTSSDEFDSSVPWDLIDETTIIANLLGKNLDTTKATKGAEKKHATPTGVSLTDLHIIGLSTQILEAAAADDDFCLDEEAFISVMPHDDNDSRLPDVALEKSLPPADSLGDMTQSDFEEMILSQRMAWAEAEGFEDESLYDNCDCI